MSGKTRVCLAMLVPVLMIGCQNEEYYRDKREKNAAQHFKEISAMTLPKGKVYSLEECVGYAIKNNLDLKVYSIKEAVSSSDKYAEILKMLPEANLSLDLSERNNQPASQSIDVNTGDTSLDFSKSSERYNEKFNVDIAFSAIDFGVAYLSSVQAQDRILLNKQLERRAAQNLAYDVTRAYFMVAATQDAMERTEVLLKRCGELDKLFDELIKSRQVSPLRLLDERKRFIRVEEALRTFRKNHADACAELKNLMGVTQDSELSVDTATLNTLDKRIFELPDIYFLEKVALRERPELYQLDLQRHITALEGSKTIIKMFPNVRAFLDFTQDSNQFLYNHSWIEIGIRAAYHTARIPSQFMEYKALTTEQRELDVRTLALSFGVLSQVRVARQNIDEVYRRFELDDRVYKSYKEHLENIRARFGKGGEVTRLDLDRLELETVETEIIRIQALGNCYMAYFRLLNTLGMRPTSFENTNKQFAAIKLALDNELPMCLGMHYVRDDGTIVFNGIDFENSLSGNERGILDEFSDNGFRMKKLPPPLTFPIDEKLLRAKVEARVKDSIKTFLSADSERETIVPTGEVKADGSIVFNGVEFKGEPTMSDSERAALERLDRAAEFLFGDRLR